jgi:hypothetical protein
MELLTPSILLATTTEAPPLPAHINISYPTWQLVFQVGQVRFQCSITIYLCIFPLGSHSTPGSSRALYPYRHEPVAYHRPIVKDEHHRLNPSTPKHICRSIEAHDAYVCSSA